MPIADMPQANKQHAVPQNIMDVEFKLIGDLTLRQFIYLLVCGGISYLLYVSLVGFFKIPLAAFFAILGMALAFVPIQERGLDEWLVNFIRAVYSPTQRIWRRELTIPSAFMHENLAVVKQELITLAPTSSRRKLEEFLEYQVKKEKIDPLDIPETEYIQKVRDAYGGYYSPGPIVDVGVLEPLDASALGQVPSEEVQPQQQEERSPQSFEAAQSTEKIQSTAEPETKVSDVSPVPGGQVKEQPLTEAPAAFQSTQSGEQRPPTPAKPSSQPQHAQIKRAQNGGSPGRNIRPISLNPITPDRHAGRRFVNLVPGSGELVLPIRGERVIKTTEQVEIDEDIQEKAKKLQDLLAQIKADGPTVVVKPAIQPQPASAPTPTQETQYVPPVQNDISTQKLDTEAANIAGKMEEDNRRISEEINKLKQEKTQTTSAEEAAQKDAMIKRLETEKARSRTDFESLQKQILELQNKLKEQTSNPVDTNKPVVPSPKFTSGQVVPGGKVNILGGRVALANGAVQTGILIIVKNEKGETVRAFKTNQLGEFKLSTPLANGIYTVEVSTNVNGVTFDIISIEAKGEPMPYMEIIGK